MKIKSIGQFISKIALISCAALFLVATWILAMEDRASSATVTAAVAFGFAALYFLPLFESIEAFGLNAKLRSQVNEAQALIESIRSTATASARASVEFLARMDSMKSPSWGTRRKLFEGITANLEDLRVDHAKLAEIREPFIRFVAVHLFRLFWSIVNERYYFERKKIDQEISTRFPTNVITDPAHEELIRRRNQFSGSEELLRYDMEDAAFSIKAKVANIVPQMPLSDHDRNALIRLGDRLAEYEQASRAAGTITADTEAFLGKYEGHQKWFELYEDTFGEKVGA